MKKPTLYDYFVFEDKLPGGAGDDAEDSDFYPEELRMGIEHEREHTSDDDVAAEIARDHLSDNPSYYSDLKKAKIESLSLVKILQKVV